MKTCQYCNEEISGRAKQCKACAAVKNDAFRYGTLAACETALATAKRKGLTGQAVRDFAEGKKEEQAATNNAEADKRRAERERAQEQKREQRAGYCRECGCYDYTHEQWCEFGTPG